MPDLLGQIPADEQIGTVTANSACDTRRCHTAITNRQATPIFPIRKNGRAWKDDCPAARARNDTLRATRHFGRAFWKRRTGYHDRSRIEARMRCLKAFGDRIMARDPDRQTAEIHIRICILRSLSRTVQGWLPRGKGVSGEAGMISVAAMYTASGLQHVGCAP